MNAPAFRKGGDAAAEASKTAQFNRGSRIGYFSLDEGEKKILRYITDYNDLIYVAQHNSCPTKNKPSDYDGKWPEAMTAVCRYDAAFSDIHSDCYICDHEITNKYGKKVTSPIRIWALAVEREEVIGDGSEALGGPDMKGKRVGCQDVMEEVEVVDKDGKATGEKKWQRKYVIVNFAQKNYFSGLGVQHAEYGSINDRDFKITRAGKDTDTIYNHLALEPTANLKPGTEKWQTKYIDDLAERGIDLGEIVADKASDDYYARFFDPTAKSDGGKAKPSAEAEVESEPAEDQKERVNALRDRVRSSAAADID